MMHIRSTAMVWYMAAVVAFFAGVIMAAVRYPNGYDWVYTVVSSLASQKRNPEGGYWFAAALSLSMALMWYSIALLKKVGGHRAAVDRTFLQMLHVAVMAAFVVGLERLLFYDLSAMVDKLHEFIALIAFIAFYAGTLGLLVRRMQQQKIYLLPMLAVAVPIIVIGAVVFWLYLAQRGIGWVGVEWREMEIPFWLSFAFWQWLEVAFLWLGLGFVVYGLGHGEESAHSSYN